MLAIQYLSFTFTLWSTVIRERRLRWTGHLLRLDENTPASVALQEAIRKIGKKKRGNFKLWKQIVNEDLRIVQTSLEDRNIKNLSSNREAWNELITEIL